MVKSASPRPRLDANAWIDAALEALGAEGPAAVRVEALAKRLSVTKGSFYWHFRDREDLLHRALDAWATARIAAIAEQAHGGDDPAATLDGLLSLYTKSPNPRGLAVELSIRALARQNEAAAAATARVDEARLAQVAALFERQGMDTAEAAARALLFYSFLFGQSLLGGTRRNTAIARAARRILAAS
ncbi:MAG: TetR/AcrR family transcriptional regulator [Rhodospirillales bacterium]|nr:TetR/AcrR family transcriptional regulator [Rhodospirillales bacterium]